MNTITEQLSALATTGNNVILTVSLGLIVGLVIIIVSEMVKHD